MTLKDCTKDELIWYLEHKTLIEPKHILLDVVHYRWEKQEELCQSLREKAIKTLRTFADLGSGRNTALCGKESGCIV